MSHSSTPPLHTPAEMLALVERGRLDVAAQRAAGVPWILLAWGVAFLVGFGALWWGQRPSSTLTVPAALALCGAAMGGAIAVSAVLGARMGRGVRSSGAVEWVGPVFGLAWPVGLGGLAVLGAGLIVNGMDSELLWVFLPTAAVFFVGIMYVIAGGIWPSWPTILMGAWFIAVAAAAPFTGRPSHLLVLALAGGGMFLLGALFVGSWTLRQRARAARR